MSSSSLMVSLSVATYRRDTSSLTGEMANVHKPAEATSRPQEAGYHGVLRFAESNDRAMNLNNFVPNGLKVELYIL